MQRAEPSAWFTAVTQGPILGFLGGINLPPPSQVLSADLIVKLTGDRRRENGQIYVHMNVWEPEYRTKSETPHAREAQRGRGKMWV